MKLFENPKIDRNLKMIWKGIGTIETPCLDGFQPHPEYCELYYLCKDSTPYLMKCSEDYVFDITTGKCNYKKVTQCGKRRILMKGSNQLTGKL